jgi:hypothetical protein
MQYSQWNIHSGSYIKTCKDIELDGNKSCAITKHKCKWSECIIRRDCIIFDECSFIENIEYILVDTRVSNCKTNNNISILEQKIDLIIKIINLQQDMKYRGLVDFYL